MTAICVPIFVKARVDLEEVIGESEEALRDTSGMIELRCDTASEKQMLEAIDLARVPVIVTIRPTWEGGFSEKSDAERVGMWERAMEAGANYVDVELVSWEKSRAIREAVENAAEKNGTRVILSNHCFDRRPGDLTQRVARLRAVKAAHVLKLAWKAESLLDAVEALAMMRRARQEDKRPMAALAMGEEGRISRLLARKFGAPFTFATVERGSESAPGQPTVRELREIYRWEKQSERAAVFGVVGWPVGHSLSPQVHNAGFEAVGAAGVYVPLAVKGEYDEFAGAMNGLRQCEGMNLRGISITIPHKENALRYVTERGGTMDALARDIGAVNTIVWDDAVGGGGGRGMRGFNSDCAGALDALASAWDGQRATLAGKHVAVIGAGGAARAVVAGLLSCGANVVIYNRTFEKAVALELAFHGTSAGSVAAAPWEELAGSSCDAYINCTPLGMHPRVDGNPITGDPPWSAETVVFDTVYNPLKTKFIKLAELKGAKVVLGTEMFIRQAAAQFREFTGRDAPADLFRKVLLAALRGTGF